MILERRHLLFGGVAMLSEISQDNLIMLDVNHDVGLVISFLPASVIPAGGSIISETFH